MWRVCPFRSRCHSSPFYQGDQVKYQSYVRTLAVAATIVLAQNAPAQRHEVGLTLGALTANAKNVPGGSLDIGTGVAFPLAGCSHSRQFRYPEIPLGRF